MTKPWCSKAVAPTKALPPGTRSPNGSWRREGRAAEPALVLETAKQARPEPPISTMQAARLRADRSKRPTRFPQSRSTECAAPQDVKVIGFDGVTSGTYATPSLSTIQVDLDQLAKFAVDMIVERIERGEVNDNSSNAGNSNDAGTVLPPSRATIGYQLVERESTTAII